MKLIVESNFENVEHLVEDLGDGKKNLYVTGTFMQQEIDNRNGRFYSAHVMEPEANRYINEKVNQNSAWGNLDHPDSPKIELSKASHRTVSLVQEGNNWMGKALILNNPHGNMVRSLLDGGGRIGVSSRAVGTLKKNARGINEVQKDFRLSTVADIVADPSAPDAFVNGILESKEWIWANGEIMEAEIDSYSKQLKSISASQKNELAVSLFETFLAKLRFKNAS